MKIGVFDSGLGGLFVMQSLTKKLPEYDYLYLGDTARVPYGNRSKEAVYQFLEEAVSFLFKEGCGLIIVACNTASAEALQKIQQKYLPKHYPHRRVLGVIIPTAEVATTDLKNKKIGVLGTLGTVNSGTYPREIKKLDRRAIVYQNAAPLLVPLIENDGRAWAEPIVRSYVKPLMAKKVGAIILGCTHYPAFKSLIRRITKIKIISQDEIIPQKVKEYLGRHPEIEKKLSKNKKRALLVTDITPQYERIAQRWLGSNAKLKKISL